MNKINHYQKPAKKRQKRVRARFEGQADRPRLSVFRSNRYVFLQAVDDQASKTIASVHAKQVLTKKKSQSATKTEVAQESAVAMAQKLLKRNIKSVVFDRGPYKYHGRVKVVAETLRQKGVQV